MAYEYRNANEVLERRLGTKRIIIPFGNSGVDFHLPQLIDLKSSKHFHTDMAIDFVVEGSTLLRNLDTSTTIGMRLLEEVLQRHLDEVKESVRTYLESNNRIDHDIHVVFVGLIRQMSVYLFDETEENAGEFCKVKLLPNNSYRNMVKVMSSFLPQTEGRIISRVEQNPALGAHVLEILVDTNGNTPEELQNLADRIRNIIAANPAANPVDTANENVDA